MKNLSTFGLRERGNCQVNRNRNSESVKDLQTPEKRRDGELRLRGGGGGVESSAVKGQRRLL